MKATKPRISKRLIALSVTALTCAGTALLLPMGRVKADPAIPVLTLPTTRMSVNDKPLSVQIALSRYQLAAGMKDRDAPPADQGILFAYPCDLAIGIDSSIVKAPLEVAFIDSEGSVDSVASIQPGTFQDITPYRNAMYSLVMNPGTAAKFGIARRAKIELPDVSHIPVPSEPLSSVAMKLGNQTLTIEVADELIESCMGLMYRDSMPDDRGMLFTFAKDIDDLAFYMRNTRIPLDIVYVNSNKTIVSIKQMYPFKMDSVPAGGPTMYAIELNLGMAEKLGLKAGQQVEFPDLTKLTAP